MSKIKKEIYNLEFPPYVSQLEIGGYIFKRIDNYNQLITELQHFVNISGSENPIQPNTGKHMITATVSIPENEIKCCLPWTDPNSTQILDVLFLLTIFTGRSVFVKEWEGDAPIIADHRIHQWGGQLQCSIKYEGMWRHKDTGEIKTEQEMEKSKIPIFDYDHIDIGFEKSLNKILTLISNPEWQEKYSGGYFLFLFRDATFRQILEKSFLTCWTIWEQIFSIENSKWLPDEEIFRLGGDRKIAYILNKYFNKKIDKRALANIKQLAKSRNRLVHFGKKTNDVTNEEKEMFIRLTEQLIALILGLEPSNIFNSLEKLNSFLNKQPHC
ncbi:MAG: hypothetical protein WC675_03630 [Patescibacteria group bacterium]|jgi:hypothetical protein